jgi:hypothetical protein
MEKARLAERRRQSWAHLHSEQNAYSESAASDLMHGDVADVDQSAGPTPILCPFLILRWSYAPDDQILSPPNEPSSTPSPAEWPAHTSSISESSVPSSTTTSSRTSTLVNEPTERRWSLLSSRVPVYVWSFFGHRANTARQPSLDDASHPRCDSATTSPV